MLFFWSREILKILNGKKQSIAKKITGGLIAIVIALVAVSGIALIGFHSFHSAMKDISNKGLPDITRRAKLNNLISHVLSETERLISAESSPVQRLAYGNIEQSMEEIGRIVGSDFELNETLSNEIEVINSTLEELNDMVTENVAVSSGIQELMSRLFDFSEEIIKFEQDTRVTISDQKTYSGLSTWTGHMVAIINKANQAGTIDAMYKIKILRNSLSRDFANLEKISGDMPADLRLKMKAVEEQLSDFVISDDGLVDKIEEAIKVSLQKYGRGNFTRNMVEDFKNRNTSGFNTLINYTADNSRLLSERIGQMTLIFAVVSIGAFMTSGFVVVYFRKNLVQRLMRLNKAILGRLAGDDVDIDTSGNDEITDMAKVFVYYDNEVSNREEKLRKIAMIDELTGVSNRRHFMELGEKELQRSIRYKHNACLLMMDIDHFKSVNDTYGHHIGDLVLQNIADICANALRDNDLFGRLGGEEFAAVLVETDPDEARLVAERIRELVESAKMDAEGELISCTISIGIVCAYERYDSLESLMVSADKALYSAKNNGRNRVETFKISPAE